MEAAHRDRDTGGADRPRNVERAGILVRLHADETEQAEVAVFAEAADQLRDIHAGVGFIDHVDIDRNIGTEHLAFRGVEREAVNRSERVGRDQRPPPADHIAVVVIMRRFDQDELEPALGADFGTFHRRHVQSLGKKFAKSKLSSSWLFSGTLSL